MAELKKWRVLRKRHPEFEVRLIGPWFEVSEVVMRRHRPKKVLVTRAVSVQVMPKTIFERVSRTLREQGAHSCGLQARRGLGSVITVKVGGIIVDLMHQAE